MATLAGYYMHGYMDLELTFALFGSLLNLLFI
jgi:hypothetical protein